MVGVAGAAFTVTVVPALAALWQPEHLSLNRYASPILVTEIDWIAPWTINTNYPHLTLTLPRYHRKRLLIRLSYGGVAGAAFTVTVVPELAALWQPKHLSQTVYSDVVTEIDWVVAPVDHKYELPT
jgi:hypothetical protein